MCSSNEVNEVKLWYFGPTKIKCFTVTNVPKNKASLELSFLNKEDQELLLGIGRALQKKNFGHLTSYHYQKEKQKERRNKKKIDSKKEKIVEVTWEMVHNTGKFVKLNEHNYAYQAPYHTVCSLIDLEDIQSFLINTEMLLPDVSDVPTHGMAEKVECFRPIFPSRTETSTDYVIEKLPREGWHNRLQEFYSEKLFNGVKSAFKDVCDVFGHYRKSHSFGDVLTSLCVPSTLKDTFLIQGKPDILMVKKNKEGVVISCADNTVHEDDEELMVCIY